jgi:hypothetical protein
MWKHICHERNIVMLQDGAFCKFCNADRTLAAQRYTLIVNEQEEKKFKEKANPKRFSIKDLFKKKEVDLTYDEHRESWQDRIG